MAVEVGAIKIEEIAEIYGLKRENAIGARASCEDGPCFMPNNLPIESAEELVQKHYLETGHRPRIEYTEKINIPF